MATPPVLNRAREIMQRYDVIYCDVWGVVHNGQRPFDNACLALTRFRNGGGTVILVSNAPVPKHRVEEMLARVAVPEDTWDDIVSSGEIALTHIAEAGYERGYFIGPRERDAAFFSRVSLKPASIEEADAIICTGLNDDKTETEKDYEADLARGVARGLPFVCANPDKWVDIAGKHFLCAGALGDLYETLGGRVHWAGKPHASAYESARQRAEELRGAPVLPAKSLVIGDSLRTDIEGARRMGLDALFVASGIHHPHTMHDGAIDERRLAKLFAGEAPPAIAAMVELAW